MTETLFECPDCGELVNTIKLEFMKETRAGQALNTRLKFTCEKGHEIEWNV